MEVSGSELLIQVLGGIALLLWGVRMVRTGVTRAYGERIRRIIGRSLKSRASAFFTGIAATALLQSGTATTLIVTGFAGSGLIAGSAGLAVLLGADVGSTLVAQVLVSGIAWLSPLLIFAGYLLFTFAAENRPRNLGRIVMGLGLVLLALKLVVAASQPLREATLFHTVLAAVGREPALALLLGGLATWAAYSSLAIILLIATFAANGSLDPLAAFALVLGANLGGGLPAVTATLAAPREARRLPLANLLGRALCTIIALPLLPAIAPWVAALAADPLRQVVNFHTAFNLAAALVLLPFTGWLMALMARLLPERKAVEDALARPRYLDRALSGTPAMALSQAEHETIRMTELLERMFRTATEALDGSSLETLKAVSAQDKQLNHYHAAIRRHLTELVQDELEAAEGRRAMEIMTFVSNLEHAGDIIDLNLADRIKAKIKGEVAFAADERQAFERLVQLVREDLRLAMAVFASRDLAGARQLIANKTAFRTEEHRTIEAHFRNVEAGRVALGPGSSVFVDLIRDLHRLNSHVVSVAYPILEEAGELRETRLKVGENEQASS